MVKSVNFFNKVLDFFLFLGGVLTSEHWLQDGVSLDSDLLELLGSDLDDMSDLLDSLNQLLDGLLVDNQLLLQDGDLGLVLGDMDGSDDLVNSSSDSVDLVDQLSDNDDLLFDGGLVLSDLLLLN